MNDLEFLLTDEFHEFSKKISAIHTEKKKMKEELKKVYDQFQAELKLLDSQANDVVNEWEQWKLSQQKAV